MASIGYLEIELDLEGCFSLKDRRQVVQSVLNKVRSKFRITAADVSSSEYTLNATVGLAVLANSPKYLKSVMDKVESFVADTFPDRILTVDRETFDTREDVMDD